MGEPRRISDSAFLVNESRARNVELSRDRYAALWVTEATRRLWEDFSRDVYPLDDIELPLRNRFYLDVLEKALRQNPDVVLVNLAAGFTSYPFLTEKPCRAIEVDFDHVCAFKRGKIDSWKREGVLPDREVEFFACDLRSGADVERLAARLKRETGPAESVAFLEGITYYLPEEALQRLFAVLKRVQNAGSLVALDFWTPETAAHPVHARFKKFCASRFGHGEADYTLFDPDYLDGIAGYRVVERTDIAELEKRFSSGRKLVHPDEILPEHYAVLERRRERKREDDTR